MHAAAARATGERPTIIGAIRREYVGAPVGRARLGFADACRELAVSGDDRARPRDAAGDVASNDCYVRGLQRERDAVSANRIDVLNVGYVRRHPNVGLWKQRVARTRNI